MNISSSDPFPNTRQDLSNLQDTAADAANDLGSTAAVHASRVKDQVGAMASHAKQEGSEQLEAAQSKLAELADAARDFIGQHPLKFVLGAFFTGYIFGWLRRK